MISVVIPAYNAAQTIGSCLAALSNQSLEPTLYEIIVVDDGSTDGTGRIAKDSGAKVISQPRSWPAAARNSGVEYAGGEIVCFTDADCVPNSNWLDVGCKGIYATRQRSLVARFVQLEYEDKYDLLRRQEYIDFIDTHSAAYRREVLQVNNGFDSRFHYLEDQELSFRFAARGYKMVFQPRATVCHLHAATLTQYTRKKIRIGFWKAQVVRRFPERGLKDSYTPQSMKLQMGLMFLLYLFTISLIFSYWAIFPLAISALAFLLTTAPFVRKSWGKDRTVTLIAPLMIAARATALGIGYAWGVIRPESGVSSQETTIGGLNYILKRLTDIVGSLLGLITVAVLGPPIALAIKISSPGSILFQQERVGQGGQPFVMYKFRSMWPGAQDQLQDLVDIDELAEPAFKLAEDPRITPLGKVLRRWSLDELPQFWNVLVGDMSLVGPRPEEVQIVALYDDLQRRRLSVKPGMTGPMQIDERGDLPLRRRLELELDYIDNYSYWHDMRIIVQTFPAIIRGKGAR